MRTPGSAAAVSGDSRDGVGSWDGTHPWDRRGVWDLVALWVAGGEDVLRVTAAADTKWNASEQF